METPSRAEVAPDLVLLHGLGTGPGAWAPQIEALGEDRSVLAPALRLDPAFTIASEAERLWVMLDSSPIDLCGLSIGALLAMRMALDRPDRVRRLVLCGGFALLPRRLRVLQTLMGGLVTLVPEARLRNQLAASVPSAGREAARSETAGLTRAAIRDAFREGRRFDVSEEIARLVAPTLVLVGERDRLNVGLSRDLARRLPNAQLVALPGAGHVANLDAPDAFTAAVRAFL